MYNYIIQSLRAFRRADLEAKQRSFFFFFECFEEEGASRAIWESLGGLVGLLGGSWEASGRFLGASWGFWVAS